MHTATMCAGRFRGHPADYWFADAILVHRLKLVADDAEPATFQLVDVPEIAAVAVLLEPEHEQVVAASVNACSGVALRQKPDIAAIVPGPMGLQQRGLQRARPRSEQFAGERRLDEPVARKRPAGR